YRGLKIHNQRVHCSKNAVSVSSDKSFSCPLCPNTIFKKQSRLSRHETFKHSNYNIPPKNLLIPSSAYIAEAKNVLVYLIQSRLKLHIKHTGLQTVSAPFKNWEHRIYEHGQRSEVILVSETSNDSQLNLEQPEMIIIWKKCVINDEDGNRTET
ncbi:213_t:CDS:2, partial [Cetraspora pellucida]